jgi:hypothetical protein
MDKTFKIVDGDISDGYHTFDELYEHRVLLFLVCVKSGAFKASLVCEDHYPGWDVITSHTSGAYNQISYHVPIKYRPIYESLTRVSKKEQEESFDGHDSKLVAHRIEMMLRNGS